MQDISYTGYILRDISCGIYKDGGIMGHRVSAIEGENPIIIVVPHGYDDPNTSIVGEQIIHELGAYGVINHGWERADKYDYYKDKANCNDINHLHEDVVKDEFLEPLLRFANKIGDSNVFIIHGVSNTIRNQASDLDLIIGCGQGKPDSLTCERWYLDVFMEKLIKQGFNPYVGKAGGTYSGRKKSNLNQLFRLWPQYFNDAIYSLQIEVVRELRKDELTARSTGDMIANAIEDSITTNPQSIGSIVWNEI